MTVVSWVVVCGREVGVGRYGRVCLVDEAEDERGLCAAGGLAHVLSKEGCFFIMVDAGQQIRTGRV